MQGECPALHGNLCNTPRPGGVVPALATPRRPRGDDPGTNPSAGLPTLSPLKHLFPKHFQHAIEVVVDIAIQDPHNPDPERLDEFCAASRVPARPVENGCLHPARSRLRKNRSHTVRRHIAAKLAAKRLRPLSRDHRMTSASGIELRSCRRFVVSSSRLKNSFMAS